MAGLKIRLSPGARVDLQINFELDQDRLDATGKLEVARLAQALQDPAVSGERVLLVGHTDLTGTAEHNLDLSIRRAKTVQTALTVEYGINARRIEIEGRGMREPLFAGVSDEENRINRRVAVRMVP